MLWSYHFLLLFFFFLCVPVLSAHRRTPTHPQHNRSTCWVIFSWSISSFSLGLWHLAKQHFFRKSAALDGAFALLSQQAPCIDLKPLRASGTDWGHRGMWKNRLLVGARSFTFTYYFCKIPALLQAVALDVPAKVLFQVFFFLYLLPSTIPFIPVCCWVSTSTPLGVSGGKTTDMMTKEDGQETNTATHANTADLKFFTFFFATSS